MVEVSAVYTNTGFIGTMCIPFSAVPPKITSNMIDKSSDKVTIDWANSAGSIETFSVLRYILDVRVYVSAGPGKERTESLPDYPLELPETPLQTTVGSLSKIVHSTTVHLTCDVTTVHLTCDVTTVHLTCDVTTVHFTCDVTTVHFTCGMTTVHLTCGMTTVH